MAKAGGVSPHKFVPRFVSVQDKDISNFPNRNAWRVDELDLSAIVPSNAKAVLLTVNVQGVVGNVLFRTNGGVAAKNQTQVITDGSVNEHTHTEWISIDADGLLDYYVTTSVTALGLTVLGWMI